MTQVYKTSLYVTKAAISNNNDNNKGSMKNTHNSVMKAVSYKFPQDILDATRDSESAMNASDGSDSKSSQQSSELSQSTSSVSKVFGAVPPSSSGDDVHQNDLSHNENKSTTEKSISIDNAGSNKADTAAAPKMNALDLLAKRKAQRDGSAAAASKKQSSTGSDKKKSDEGSSSAKNTTSLSMKEKLALLKRKGGSNSDRSHIAVTALQKAKADWHQRHKTIMETTVDEDSSTLDEDVTPKDASNTNNTNDNDNDGKKRVSLATGLSVGVEHDAIEESKGDVSINSHNRKQSVDAVMVLEGHVSYVEGYVPGSNFSVKPLFKEKVRVDKYGRVYKTQVPVDGVEDGEPSNRTIQGPSSYGMSPIRRTIFGSQKSLNTNISTSKNMTTGTTNTPFSQQPQKNGFFNSTQANLKASNSYTPVRTTSTGFTPHKRKVFGAYAPEVSGLISSDAKVSLGMSLPLLYMVFCLQYDEDSDAFCTNSYVLHSYCLLLICIHHFCSTAIFPPSFFFWLWTHHFDAILQMRIII